MHFYEIRNWAKAEDRDASAWKCWSNSKTSTSHYHSTRVADFVLRKRVRDLEGQEVLATFLKDDGEVAPWSRVEIKLATMEIERFASKLWHNIA